MPFKSRYPWLKEEQRKEMQAMEDAVEAKRRALYNIGTVPLSPSLQGGQSMGGASQLQPTGAGPDGVVQPDRPVEMVRTTEGPRMIHEGEAKMQNMDGSTTVIPQKQLMQMESQFNVPGYQSGGTYNTFDEFSKAVTGNVGKKVRLAGNQDVTLTGLRGDQSGYQIGFKNDAGNQAWSYRTPWGSDASNRFASRIPAPVVDTQATGGVLAPDSVTGQMGVTSGVRKSPYQPPTTTPPVVKQPASVSPAPPASQLTLGGDTSDPVQVKINTVYDLLQKLPANLLPEGQSLSPAMAKGFLDYTAMTNEQPFYTSQTGARSINFNALRGYRDMLMRQAQTQAAAPQVSQQGAAAPSAPEPAPAAPAATAAVTQPANTQANIASQLGFIRENMTGGAGANTRPITVTDTTQPPEEQAPGVPIGTGTSQLRRYAAGFDEAADREAERVREQFKGEEQAAVGATAQQASQLGLTPREAMTEEAMRRREIGAQEADVMGELAKTRGERAFAATQQLPGTELAEKRFGIEEGAFGLTLQQYDDSIKRGAMMDAATAGDYDTFAQAYKDLYGRDVDPSVMKTERTNAMTLGGLGVDTARFGLLAQKIESGATFDQVKDMLMAGGATESQAVNAYNAMTKNIVTAREKWDDQQAYRDWSLAVAAKDYTKANEIAMNAKMPVLNWSEVKDDNALRRDALEVALDVQKTERDRTKVTANNERYWTGAERFFNATQKYLDASPSTDENARQAAAEWAAAQYGGDAQTYLKDMEAGGTWLQWAENEWQAATDKRLTNPVDATMYAVDSSESLTDEQKAQFRELVPQLMLLGPDAISFNAKTGEFVVNNGGDGGDTGPDAVDIAARGSYSHPVAEFDENQNPLGTYFREDGAIKTSASGTFRAPQPGQHLGFETMKRSAFLPKGMMIPAGTYKVVQTQGSTNQSKNLWLVNQNGDAYQIKGAMRSANDPIPVEGIYKYANGTVSLGNVSEKEVGAPESGSDQQASSRFNVPSPSSMKDKTLQYDDEGNIIEVPQKYVPWTTIF